MMNHNIIWSLVGIIIFVTETDSWQPSIVAFKNFVPSTDAQILRKAMKGFGTDESAIINVVMSRNHTQRKIILKEFNKMYKRDLIKDLTGELGGNLEDIVLGMFLDHYDFIASELKNAIKGLGTNEETLNELLCCRTTTDMQMVKTAYKNRYKESLEKDVKSDTHGDYQKLLLAFISKPRGTSSGDQEAKDTVAKLIKAGLAKVGTDEDVFIKIFSGSSFPLLKKVGDEYFKTTGRTLKDAVDSETSGDLKHGLMNVVDWTVDSTKFFISKLHSALDKRFPDKHAILRIFVMRAEIDLKAIADEFLKSYNRSLKSFMIDKTSGDFRNALIAVVNGNV